MYSAMGLLIDQCFGIDVFLVIGNSNYFANLKFQIQFQFRLFKKNKFQFQIQFQLLFKYF